MEKPKMKVTYVRLGEDTFKKLQTYADCFNTTVSELMRNWIEDALYFLENEIVEVDMKRHLAVKNEKKRLIEDVLVRETFALRERDRELRERDRELKKK